MSNVLIVYEMLEPCGIEMIRMAKLLEKQDKIFFRDKLIRYLEPEDICWCDIIISVRSTSFFEWGLAKYCHSIGKYWILILDDDFLGLNNEYGKDSEGYWSLRQKYLKKILQYIDCLLVVNPLLAQKYIEFCNSKRYVVTNTIIEREEIANLQYNNNAISNKVKIVLYVNDGTLDMFNKIIKPVVKILSAQYNGKISLYFLGLKPDLEEYTQQLDIHYVPHMVYSDFKKYMIKENFDIGLAPLESQGFSTYKYFNKYIEYTVAGIPGIYSNCKLYNQVIINEYNGILCNNTPEEWYFSIKQYIESCHLRKVCIENAQKHIYKNFSSDIVLNKLVKDVPELGSFKAPTVNPLKTKIILYLIKFGYYIFRLLGWLRIISVYVKNRNVKGLVNRFREKFLKKNNYTSEEK